MDLCRKNTERQMSVESQGGSAQFLNAIGIDPACPVPPYESFRDPGAPYSQGIGKAAEEPAKVFSVVLVSPDLS
jgi:hypothetical protein